MIYGAVFSREYIDSEKIDPIPVELHKWIKADIKEVIDKEIPKAKSDLRQVEQHLAQMLKELEEYTPGTQDYNLAYKKMADAEIGVTINKSKLEFYNGKVYLLNKRLSVK